MAKRHLLFVDDEPMVLKGLQRTLRSIVLSSVFDGVAVRPKEITCLRFLSK